MNDSETVALDVIGHFSRGTMCTMRRLLIEWREDKGLSREALALELGCNPRSVTRWETGESTPRMTQRASLARLLGKSVADILRALDDNHGLINEHRVLSHLTHFASCEQGATEIRCWEPIVVPGLFQTPDYAAAIERSIADTTESDIAERVQLRLWRQGVLTRPGNPLRLFAVVDASALIREVGGSAVMDDQLAHLREMAALPNVSIRVAPLRGVPCAGWGSFHLLTGDGRSPYMAVTNEPTGFHYHEMSSAIATYVGLWERLWEGSDDFLAKEHLQRS
jgi:DNA-binding XRE family transcriptional regulator